MFQPPKKCIPLQNRLLPFDELARQMRGIGIPISAGREPLGGIETVDDRGWITCGDTVCGWIPPQWSRHR